MNTLPAQNTTPPALVTRLAPSPTGALHLGNARTFLANWLLARQRGWRILLRIEDLDGPRIKRGAEAGLIDDLAWLGLDWDDGPIHQSTRTRLYRDAIERLLAQRLAYPCTCSRRDIDFAASAPHADDGATVYPGTCRGRFASLADAAATGRPPAIRFRVPDETITFTDLFHGPVAYDMTTLGDFVIAKAVCEKPAALSRGTGFQPVRATTVHPVLPPRTNSRPSHARSNADATAAYQLAVVVDDADMSITHIVRGDDLLDSTPRQLLLYHALGLASRIPAYCHLPLVVGADGRRLAKRHGDTRLAHYRDLGVPASQILALLARWCGIDLPRAGHPRDLLDRFDLDSIPRHPIVFTPADDELLRRSATIPP